MIILGVLWGGAKASQTEVIRAQETAEVAQDTAEAHEKQAIRTQEETGNLSAMMEPELEATPSIEKTRESIGTSFKNRESKNGEIDAVEKTDPKKD